MPITAPSASKGKSKAAGRETNEQAESVSNINVATSPPTPSNIATTQPPEQPKVSYIRNCDLANLRKSPDPTTRQTVVHIFRRILVLELVILFSTVLSITLRGHFSFERMRKDLHSVINIWHAYCLTDFSRIIGSVVNNAMPERQDDPSFEPTGNLVTDEIKRRGWALFPARQAPKRVIPQNQRPLVDPGILSSNYGSIVNESCVDPRSSSSSSSNCSPGTLPSEATSSHPAPPETPKPTLLSVGKLAYSQQQVLALAPARLILQILLGLYFLGFDIDRRHDCLQKLPDCIPAYDDSPPWLVAVIAMDICFQLMYFVESTVVYRAKKQIERLLDKMAAANETETQALVDASVSA